MPDHFAENLEAAKVLYKIYKEKDPFIDIPPALLNSADIIDYIQKVGMVFPFELQEDIEPKDRRLKGATLSLRIGEVGIYWNEKQKKIVKKISVEKEFILKSNSIAYVEIHEYLQLPNYIIARFNLRVTNAYKGILLGTGPIIDPGFNGKLFIPLHNLTNNDYIFYVDDPLIDMEFTKLSPHRSWNPKARKGRRYHNWVSSSGEKDPSTRDLEYYLRRANNGRSIESSLPSLKTETKKAIDRSNKTSDKVDTSLSRFNVGLLFAFAALLTAIVGIVNVFRGDIREIKEQRLQEKIERLETQRIKDSQELQTIKDSLRNNNILPREN